jgi:hypothetical protein
MGKTSSAILAAALATLVLVATTMTPAASAQRHRHRPTGPALASQPVAPGSFAGARMIETGPGRWISTYDRSRDVCSPL